MLAVGNQRLKLSSRETFFDISSSGSEYDTIQFTFPRQSQDEDWIKYIEKRRFPPLIEDMTVCAWIKPSSLSQRTQFPFSYAAVKHNTKNFSLGINDDHFIYRTDLTLKEEVYDYVFDDDSTENKATYFESGQQVSLQAGTY